MGFSTISTIGRGVYLLVFRLPVGWEGRLGGRRLRLEPGCYLYVGSAMGHGGLAARLRRHLCGARRRLHWHIDRLLSGGEPVGAWACSLPPAARGVEPLLAAVAACSRLLEQLPGGVGGTDDPLGFSHVLRCKAGGCGGCVEAGFGVASALPCLPLWVDPGRLCGSGDSG